MKIYLVILKSWNTSLLNLKAAQYNERLKKKWPWPGYHHEATSKWGYRNVRREENYYHQCYQKKWLVASESPRRNNAIRNRKLCHAAPAWPCGGYNQIHQWPQYSLCVWLIVVGPNSTFSLCMCASDLVLLCITLLLKRHCQWSIDVAILTCVTVYCNL